MALDYCGLFDDVDTKKKGQDMATELILIGRAMSRAGEWYRKELYKQDEELRLCKEREAKAAGGHPYGKKKKTDRTAEIEALRAELAKLKGE